MSKVEVLKLFIWFSELLWWYFACFDQFSEESSTRSRMNEDVARQNKWMTQICSLEWVNTRLSFTFGVSGLPCRGWLLLSFSSKWSLIESNLASRNTFNTDIILSLQKWSRAASQILWQNILTTPQKSQPQRNAICLVKETKGVGDDWAFKD